MRRAILLAAVMLVALVAIGGMALAETLTGNDRDNRLIGSNGRDSISGGGGDDLIRGLRSIDSLNGGAGNDDIYAGPRDEKARDTVAGARGNDFVYVRNRPAAEDVVNCGAGRDRVVADSKDVLSGCERACQHAQADAFARQHASGLFKALARQHGASSARPPARDLPGSAGRAGVANRVPGVADEPAQRAC
jgi:Ca2+-binding RTX toxin-like protein